MTAVALFGAGGKMGYRLASNLKGSRFDVRHVELGEPGKKRLKDDLGVDTFDPDCGFAGRGSRRSWPSPIPSSAKSRHRSRRN